MLVNHSIQYYSGIITDICYPFHAICQIADRYYELLQGVAFQICQSNKKLLSTVDTECGRCNYVVAVLVALTFSGHW